MVRKTERSEAIDAVIGSRIRDERLARGMSRQQLAAQIDVTHQQLRKYEYGENRLSPARIVAVAAALKKPISFFFNEVETAITSTPSLHQRMAIEVSRNFLRIKNPVHQGAVNFMVRSLMENENDV